MFLGDLPCRYLTLSRLNRTHIATATRVHALERRNVARLSPGAATAFRAPCSTPLAPARPAVAVAPALSLHTTGALSTGRSSSAHIPAAGSSACSRRSAATVVVAGRASESLVCWAQRRRSFSSGGTDRDPVYDAYDYLLPQQHLEAWYWSAVAASGTESGSAAASSEDSEPEQLQEPAIQRAQLPPAVNGWPALNQLSTDAKGTMVQEADPFTQDLKQVVAEAAAAAAANGGASTSAASAGDAAADDKAAPSVDVTRHNFDAMLPAVRRYLAAADFYAFDCEMTGLFLDGHNENYLDDMQDRYNRTAASAHAYVINQFGLSCFKRLRPDGPAGERRYAAATFNFYLFPRPPEGGAAAANSSARRFTCDAGSLAFLASQGFDFNRCIYDGVPFMPVRQRDELLRQVDGDRGGNEGGGARADVVLSKPEDIAFVEGLLTTVREWLAAGAAAPLDLPPVSRYLRLLVRVCVCACVRV
ncbi:hypothetical protein HXX76_012323 [Chlamydomonas incerta]|uniref:Uncharacterized protein n=1 Tax=Chlamydomonas incerta TaxID=51695 RepID=A0A835SIL4_CHLIN|nr:hypothetical protein HXX76_012323 [Chlamydomonas incerta]|eukprot:KAG2427674.1 hypothetical protein HXX76_012323 [Chlamydomonas incerta]